MRWPERGPVPLARSLARPMPRKHALRMLGATALGVWFGGSVRKAHALGAAHWCHREVSTHGWKFCTEENEYCFPTCCPQERTCSIGPRSNRGCPSAVSCCDPCNPAGSRPDGTGGCAPGPVAAHCPCKQGQKKCNGGRGQVLCCDADEYCASSRKDEGSGSTGLLAVCCKEGQAFCLRGSPARPFCCPRGTRCCTGGSGGLVAAACCSRLTQTCDHGVCRCKPGHSVRCGKDCCHPQRHKCCGTVHKRCVPKDVDCHDAFPNA